MAHASGFSPPRLSTAFAIARIWSGVVPQQLRNLRRRANWNQKRVARLIGNSSAATVSSIERGETKLSTDDVLVFGNSLSEEYLALFQAGVLTAAELDAIRLEGLS